MLVLHVRADGECEEVYYGPFAPVRAASRYSARDNKDMIAVSKLRTLKKVLDVEGVKAAEIVAEVIPPDPLPTPSEQEE